jgi:hypothetical protein
MQAKPGDRITIRGRAVGNPDRHGEIIEARGADGGAPYVVKFDDGHESIVYPGADVVLDHQP